MKPLLLIQARMGSTRLPGKVLKPIAGKPQLQQMLERLGTYVKRKEVLVVTSDLEGDQPIADFCRDMQVECYRGSEWDVLDRFYHAAQMKGANEHTAIVRLTADCPLHHHDVVMFALEEFSKHRLDYFSNSFAPHYEDGCDTEVFRFAALERAFHEAKLLSQREHVTPFIKDSGIFICGYRKFNPEYRYKLSVDTPEDHVVAESIFRHFAPDNYFSVHDIVDLLREKPELLDANKESIINSGYTKSLQNDKEVK